VAEQLLQRVDVAAIAQVVDRERTELMLDIAYVLLLMTARAFVIRTT